MSESIGKLVCLAAEQLCDELGPLVRGDDQVSFEAAYERIAKAQDACLATLASSSLWGRSNQMPSGDFWKIAGWVVSHGPLQRRAREKPHGYAGDFEMLDQIAHDQIDQELLPGAFDRYFQDQAAPKAVRNRTQQIADQIVQTVRRRSDHVKICSVGSGPAADLKRAIEQLETNETSRMEVALFDLDPTALELAKSRLEAFQVNVNAHRVNLFRIARVQKLSSLLADSDLIFCSGLFDYLSHDDAVGMLRMFWQQLRQDGRLMAFNFSTQNRSRAYMEWFGNWYLVYRTIDQMRQLALDAGWSDDQFTVRSEAENVNLFIEAHK